MVEKILWNEIIIASIKCAPLPASALLPSSCPKRIRREETGKKEKEKEKKARIGTTLLGFFLCGFLFVCLFCLGRYREIFCIL